MKKLLLLLYLFSFTIYSQIPAGYYDTATGSNYTLKTQLYNIIKGHTDNGYGGLWITYQTSDIDKFYENDGTILDIYSENPIGVDPYNFTVTTSQCGSGGYAIEGDCYNREHIIPQSVFGKVSPMVADAHFIAATDGKVNGIRSNFPHGMVGTATYTSQNGSKLGSALNSGYSAGYTGTVFEPIDEFKGDIARMYFYFATRYENVINTWGVAYDMFDGTTDKVFAEPFLTILMTWHTQDPVSSAEIARNDAIYARQSNRNPFIDHPEYVAQIWSTTPDTQAPTAPTNLLASNITNTTTDLNWTASTDDVGVTSYEIFKDGVFLASSATNAFNVTGLTQNTTYNFTVFAKDAFGNTSTVSNTANVTTTNIIDTQAPSAIIDLLASGTTDTSTNLTWTASTDNIGVTGYDVYKNAVFLASSATNSYNVTGLTASTAYNFTVYAKDAAGNVSTVSNTAAVTTLAATTGASELFISEYIEGSSNNKAIEIANFTGSSVDLSIYSIKRNTNGGTTWGAALPLVGTLINNDVYVIANSVSNAAILAVTDLSSAADAVVFNGNDPVGLFKNDVLIDIVGTFNNGTANFAADTTLRRKSTISSPNTTYTIAEWDSFPVDTSGDLGTHTFSTLSIQELIPSLFNVYPNPATKNHVTISVANNQEINAVQFYNLMGQLVINIQQPTLIYNKVEINDIPKGMYIVKIANKNAYSTKRLIVQ